MKRVGVVILSLAVAMALAWYFRAPLAETVLARLLPQQLARDTARDLGPGLHLVLCGAGGPLPDRERSGTCVAVIAGNQHLVIDAGTGGARNLASMGYHLGDIDAVLLTHFHSDHIDGLGELAMQRWVNGAHPRPLPLLGPAGVEDIAAGFNTAYTADARYRNAHHGDGVAPLSGAGLKPKVFPVPAPGQIVTVFDTQGLRVDMIAVDHHPVFPAVGYLLHYRGRSALVSGDTAASDNVRHFARGVDLLVHEGLAPDLVRTLGESASATGNTVLAKIAADIPDYHTTPVEAATIARDAGVGHLLFYHVVPPTPLPGLVASWDRGVEPIFPDYTVGIDGTTVSLPPGGTTITVRR